MRGIGVGGDLNWDSGDSWDFVGGLVCCLGRWLFAVPHPFVRPGHPHPGPLPLSGRGETICRLASLIKGQLDGFDFDV